MPRLLWVMVLACLVILLVVTPLAQEAEQEPLVTVKGPTIVAFFPPVTERELRDDPDTNEVLADFQLYAGRALGSLRKSGIDFQQLYTRSFRVRVGNRSTRFQPGEPRIGYYFVAPGKKPRVVYGVTTDDDLVEQAKKYFALSTAK